MIRNGGVAFILPERRKEMKLSYSKLKIFRDTFIILLLFWWLLLIFLLIATISKLFDKNKKELTKEEKLDKFMINYLLCEKI